MATWKKHFQTVPKSRRIANLVANTRRIEAESGTNATGNKYSSYLPEVYAGNPNRVERYAQYDNMDQDSEVNAALDTLADFCTHKPEHEVTHFSLKFKKDVTETEKEIIYQSLLQWNSINKFDSRLWRMMRGVFMFGDQFFIRDPETSKWLWVDHKKVDKVIVDESKGKEPESYVVRDLDLNLNSLVATNSLVSDQYTNFPTAYPASPSSGSAAGYNAQSSPFSPPSSRTSRFNSTQNEVALSAKHVVHLSLSDGLDANWPFGNSILEAVFKTFKQKELLEDSVIIYRVQRAPERRVFYIDVGTLPTHKAMQFIERVKNEIHQRRIPNRTGGGTCLSLDTKIPLLDGRTLTLDDLIVEYESGKQNWVYSCNPKTGEVVPGPITWAGVTRKNTKTLKLKLDNGENIICTPDHKFPIFGKGKVEAKDIVINEDSLISFNTKLFSINGKSSSKSVDSQYLEVFNYLNKKRKFIHRLIANYFKKENEHKTFIFDEHYSNIEKNIIRHKDFKDKINSYNKVISIEEYGTIDTGTITVDVDEEFHKFHTFAIDQGVFTYNSIIDASYDPLCLDLSTVIPLLDGRRLTINELIEEYRLGKDNWTFSCDPKTGKLAAGYISWAGITKKNTNVIKLSFTNGKYLICTPDHKIPVLGKGFVEAEKLRYKYVLIGFEQVESEFQIGKKDNSFSKIYDYYERKLVNVYSLIRGDKFKNNKLITVTNKILSFFYHSIFDHYVFEHKFTGYRVASIEEIKEKRDTGTLTIIGNKYHTFPVNDSIFVKNSIIEDYFFASTADGRGSKVDTLPGGECLALDTKIKLLDGRDLELSKIIEEFKEGKQNWVYSCNPKTGEIVPGPITWAGITRENTQVVRLTFDNGESVICTPDHKFPIISKGNVEAQDLKIGESMIPHYERKSIKEPIGYTQVYDNKYKKWKYVHKLVVEYLKPHGVIKERLNDEKYLCEKKITIHHKDFNKLNNDPFNLVLIDDKDQFMYNSKLHDGVWRSIKKNYSEEYQPDKIMMDEIVNVVNSGAVNWKDVIDSLNKNKKFMSRFKALNEGKLNKNAKLSDFKYKHLQAVLTSNGYDTFRKFKSEIKYYNHKLVKIEWLDEKIDTGTITVDGFEIYSNFHNFALSACIYTKNSLGQIDDLKYFNNKLVRGLRVPSSYLPTGPEDGSTTFNDGRVGTAYIQEYRFSKYCERLQAMTAHIFDKEFKIFLKRKGVIVDSSEFKLNFHPPQNFAKYRQMEIDAAQINVFQPLVDMPFFSKRFLMKRYLNLNDVELAENQALWMEENPNKEFNDSRSSQGKEGLSSVGVRNVGMHGGEESLGGLESEEELEPNNNEEEVLGNESPISGGENSNNPELNNPNTETPEEGPL